MEIEVILGLTIETAEARKATKHLQGKQIDGSSGYQRNLSPWSPGAGNIEGVVCTYPSMGTELASLQWVNLSLTSLLQRQVS